MDGVSSGMGAIGDEFGYHGVVIGCDDASCYDTRIHTYLTIVEWSDMVVWESGGWFNVFQEWSSGWEETTQWIFGINPGLLLHIT